MISSSITLDTLQAQASIRLKQLCKSFDNITALDNIQTHIFPGKLTGLVGPDGAGKTTLLRLLCGLLSPTQGEIEILGEPQKTNQQLANLIGYMPQRFSLYENLSVIENLKLYAQLRQIPTHEQQRVFDNLLGFTRLAEFQTRLAGKLSGGMKQKLGLACALMGEPKILLLDEPGVGVDPLSRQDLWRMVTNLTHKGMTVIWATSYLDEAEHCNHTLLLNEGKIIYDGHPKNLSSQLEGRCWRLSGIKNKRKVLSDCLAHTVVNDAYIQGQSIQLTLAPKHQITELSDFITTIKACLSPTTPRFEDAFIDLLGGHKKARAHFIDAMPRIELSTPVAVSCTHLSRYFGDFCATDDVSFDVKQGEVFGLLGPNGAGKSTTFKMLCGLLKPSQGTAHITGIDLRQASSKAKSKLGYMAQKFSLYNLLNAQQNLDFSASVYGLSGNHKKTRIDDMVTSLGLSPYLKFNPENLSLGYKQRLALACSLMHSPPILFLDEPTSGVDPLTRREFWTHINHLVEKGVTVMVTTHFMDEAEYCDRIAIMYHGKLISLDTPDNIKKSIASNDQPDPSMEDAFIALINQYDAQRDHHAG